MKNCEININRLDKYRNLYYITCKVINDNLIKENTIRDIRI